MKRQYPIIDAKATGENILRRRLEQGYTTRDVQEFLHLASIHVQKFLRRTYRQSASPS